MGAILNIWENSDSQWEMEMILLLRRGPSLWASVAPGDNPISFPVENTESCGCWLSHQHPSNLYSWKKLGSGESAFPFNLAVPTAKYLRNSDFPESLNLRARLSLLHRVKDHGGETMNGCRKEWLDHLPGGWTSHVTLRLCKNWATFGQGGEALA